MERENFKIGPLRDDLEVRINEQSNKGDLFVTDPITSKLFTFPKAAYQILASIEDAVDTDEFLLQFKEKEAEAVYLLLKQVTAKSLLDTGEEITEKKFSLSSINFLFFKLVKFDPTTLLRIVSPVYKPLFSAVSLMLFIALSVYVVSKITLSGAHFWRNFEVFTYFGSWLWVYALLPIATLFHELGHAFVCNKYGGKVKEVGIALYIGQLSAYANVTDAWFIKNKWQRIKIALAGVFVEGYLAIIAFLVWENSIPFTVESQVSFVFFVVVLMRILMNIIPVLRLDGYWVLCDFIEETNLRHRSMAYLMNWLPFLAQGFRLRQEPKQGLTTVYLVFSIASFFFVILAMMSMAIAVLRFFSDVNSYVQYSLIFILFSVLVISFYNFYRTILSDYFVESLADVEH